LLEAYKYITQFILGPKTSAIIVLATAEASA